MIPSEKDEQIVEKLKLKELFYFRKQLT